MTENDATGSTPPEEELALSSHEEPGTSQPRRGSRIPHRKRARRSARTARSFRCIGGLPAVEGSAWDIGAPLEDRGAGPG